MIRAVFLAFLALGVVGCAKPHDDGAGQLWRIPGLQDK